MPKNWKTYKLGDLIKIKHGYAFKGDFFTNIINENVLLTPGNFHATGGIKFNWEKQKFYEGTVPKDYILNKNDLILALTDLTQSCDILGSPAVIKDSNYYYLHNQRLGLVNILSGELDKIFLFYYFNHSNFRNRVIATKTGSTVSHTAPERIYECELALPPLPEQRAIASILSALDDKIELNLQMNKTLEEMAMALYKHWFVDFGPFKDGEFVESELGMIPKGWEVKKLGEVFDTTSGGTPSRSKEDYYLNGEIPWIKSKELYGDFVIEAEEKISELGLKNSSAKFIQKGSILLAMYGNTVGVSSILSIDAACNQAICAISEKNLSNIYLYLFLKINKSAILNLAVGSAQQNISQQIIKQIQILVPPKDNKCFNVIELYYKKIEQNLIENKVLTVKRDSLLPKLISGEIILKK